VGLDQLLTQVLFCLFNLCNNEEARGVFPLQKLLKDIYMFKIIGKRNQRYILYLSNVLIQVRYIQTREDNSGFYQL
jgi:hypothetical protein